MTTCLIAFGAPPRELLERLPAGSTLVIGEAPPPAGFAWRPLAELLASPALDDGVAMLHELNALRDAAGEFYRSAVRYHEYRTWWFHQQTALDVYLMPFLRYRPLLVEAARAERLILVDCPEDLGRLLPLLPFAARAEMHRRTACPRRHARLRRAASAALYRAGTALAIARAAIRRPDELVYVVDAADAHGRNPWLDGLYRALEARRAQFLEIVWSPSGARALERWRMRRRAVVYWQAVTAAPRVPAPAAVVGDDVQAPLAGDELTTRFLHALAARVLLPMARASARSVRRLERLLAVLRPRGVYLMDDYVHAFELVVACRRRGIPTVALQHGQFSRYTAGLMGYGFDGARSHSFDRYCVWGEFFARLLERHSRLVPRESVVVAGSPRARGGAIGAAADEAVAVAADGATALTAYGATAPAADGATAPARRHGAQAQGGGQPPRVLFLAEHHDPAMQEREVSPYVRALAAAGFDVVIRPHPSITALPPLVPAGGAAREPRIAAGPLEDALAAADAVVGSFSSAVFEAILHGKPVVLFATSRHRDPHGLAEAGLAALAASPDRIAEEVVAAAALPAPELARRRDCVWGSGSRDAGEAAVREMERLRRRGQAAE